MPPPADDQHRYIEIAEKLAQRIDSGDIMPGVPFPSDAELTKEYGVARNTIRAAVDLLRNQGRIYTLKARGSFVRPRLPQRVISMERYRADAAAAEAGQPPTADAGAWAEHRPEVTITEEPASPEVAELFEVEPGTPLSRRDLLFRAGGFPVQVTTSYFLLDMVAGTPVVEPGSEPWPGGAIGQLASVGVRVDRVRESRVARPPTAKEAATLRLTGGCVVATTRRMLAGGRVVEVAREIVVPADGAVWEDEIVL